MPGEPGRPSVASVLRQVGCFGRPRRGTGAGADGQKTDKQTDPATLLNPVHSAGAGPGRRPKTSPDREVPVVAPRLRKPGKRMTGGGSYFIVCKLQDVEMELGPNQRTTNNSRKWVLREMEQS